MRQNGGIAESIQPNKDRADPSERKRAALIVNAKSRRGKDCFQIAREVLLANGIELVKAVEEKDPRRITRFVEQAVREKLPLVVVGGGDGTLSSVVRYFLDSDSVLGVLPLGTGNALARDLELPLNVPDACEVIASGKTVAIDVGTIEDGFFVNVATIGLSSAIARELTNDAKKRLGKLVYAVAVFRALRHIKRFVVTIEANGKREEFETVQVVVGCGRFHAGPFPLSPTSSITDGLLRIYALESCSRMALLKYAINLPGGMFTRLADIDALAASSGKISTVPQKSVTVDGEVGKYQTPISFGIRPRSVRVRVPEEFEGQ